MKTMSLISLKEENICFLESCSPEEAINSLIQNLRGEITGKEDLVLEKVLERESVVSTAIGKSIAIPHCRCSFLDDFILTVGICKDGISWKGLDDAPVRVICLLLGPEGRHQEYLSLLSSITGVLNDENLRLEILRESVKKNIVNIFLSC